MSEHRNGAKKVKHCKDTTALLSVYEFLKDRPATATETAVALNIYRPSLCRFKRALEKQGELAVLKKVRCTITGYTAGLLTTDPNLFPKRAQLKIPFQS